MLDAFVDLKFRVHIQILPDGCFWIVGRPPRPIREHFLRHVFDNRIEDYAIAVFADQWRIRLQLGKDMGMRMVAIEADQYTRIVRGDSSYLFDNLGRNTGTLNHLNTRCHRMSLNSGTIVRTNVDVDTQHLAVRNFWV